MTLEGAALLLRSDGRIELLANESLLERAAASGADLSDPEIRQVIFGRLAAALEEVGFGDGGAAPNKETVAAINQIISTPSAPSALSDAESGELDDVHQAHAARKQYQALVEASRDYISFADATGAVLYLNVHGRALVGLSPEADISDLMWSDLMDRDFAVDVVTPSMIEHGRWDGHARMRHQGGGEDLTVEASIFGVNDPDTGELLAFATVARDITDRLRAEEQLSKLAAVRRTLLERLVTAQEQERSQIAADIHDDSIQVLAAIDLRLGMVRRKVTATHPELSSEFDILRDAVATATERLRTLLFDLEPPHEAETPLGSLRSAAVHILGDDIACTAEGEDGRELSPGEHIQAVRIGKEALHNIRKHAAATRVMITMLRRGDGLEIAIADNGVGLPDPKRAASPPGHHGLTGMRDRAQIAGGWLNLEANPGGGAIVRYWLPTERV